MTSSNILKLQGRKNTIMTPDKGAHKAWLTAQLFKHSQKTIVVILPDKKAALEFMEDLKFFRSGSKYDIVYFPEYNAQDFNSSSSCIGETSISRLRVLSRLLELSSPICIVTEIATILKKLIPKKEIISFSELIMVNETIEREKLISKLESGGYIRRSLVEEPGEYAVRGGILDIFSPQKEQPIRIEFFDDLVESIRIFSPYTQRAEKEISDAVIVPVTEVILNESGLPHMFARLRHAGASAGLNASYIREYINIIRSGGRFAGMEAMLSIFYDNLDSFFHYLPKESLILLDSPDDLRSTSLFFENKMLLDYQNMSNQKKLIVNPESIYLTWNQVMKELASMTLAFFQSLIVEQEQVNLIRFYPQDNKVVSEKLRQQVGDDPPLLPLVRWFEELKRKKYKILCVLHQQARIKHLVDLLAPYGLMIEQINSFKNFESISSGLYYQVGNLSSGFVFDDQSLALITENEIFGKKKIRRTTTNIKDLKREFILPEELKSGDIIVHMEHGIGRYKGLCNLTIDRISQDFILILFRDDDKLYLPVDRIEMISKYLGINGYTPILDKIGSKNWIKSKAKAKAEVEKIASDLLELYAKRKINKGFSFSTSDLLYNDFEASFPYEETKDQLKAIEDVSMDMESSLPMDRLICGDVGYGKTEVAARAAFKAISDGKQVAIVVPTTILAEQHLITFRERFKEYPVAIDCLSRFRTRKDQLNILQQLSKGKLDIIIGTHRLFQKDVEFKSLGLLVIDEEHRFGVHHKEMLKKKRNMIDVLTLSATPIPRTLHMSLTGMRDISMIRTPPASRQPILSYILQYEDKIVKDAIENELARNGQVFFVHNEIKTIVKQAEILKSLVSHAKIGVAHGRLSETDLEKVMFQFINLEINVLVCTTIVESGLDIPSANTMIINKIEQFGLSQIYQLRGRIGRGEQQAYAYLLVSNNAKLTKDAQKRLAALMEHRDLGSGFQIAMKDLQIRGAGTALGISQSGHIAAVGYDMFLKLLDNAIRDLKGEELSEPLEPEINASMSSGFPEKYIESVEQRLTLYRRLSRMNQISEIAEIKKELSDRYGKLPSEAENMLLKIMLRIYSIKTGIKRLDVTPNTLTLFFSIPHMVKSFDDLKPIFATMPTHTFINKETIRFTLAHKNNDIFPALVKTKNILTRILRQLKIK